MPPKDTKFLNKIQLVQSLADTDGFFSSPIDVNIENKVDIELPDLEWHNYDKIARKIMITNGGCTVILGAKWNEERPYITSGPLTEKYIFSQMHFHWANTDNEGSEHTVDGHCFPVELHLVHYKCTYSNQEIALREKDGLVVMVYLFTIQENTNSKISPITDALPSVIRTQASTHITPSRLSDYLHLFNNNYFMYWGSVQAPQCAHKVLWFICREPIGISRSQLSQFRRLKGEDDEPISHVFQGVHPLNDRSLFLVNGAKPLDTTLVPASPTEPRSSSQVPKSVIATEFWPFIETISCSKLQSPIDIPINKALPKKFPPLTFTGLWGNEGEAYLENNGHTAVVTLQGRLPLLEGGPLRGSYRFTQTHFHWSLDDEGGSEHTVEGKSYSMESHAVHVHVSCENMDQALECANAIVVVGNLLKVSHAENIDFLPISDNLNKILKTNDKTQIPADCFSWMKNNGAYGYITYPGSLTTPTISKTVTWILFPDPIPVSHSQISCFSQLQDHENKEIENNCREVQDCFSRDIFVAVSK